MKHDHGRNANYEECFQFLTSDDRTLRRLYRLMRLARLKNDKILLVAQFSYFIRLKKYDATARNTQPQRDDSKAKDHDNNLRTVHLKQQDGTVVATLKRR
jgi:hypothetical protein